MGDDGFCQLAIGQWRDHLSYKRGIAITQTEGLIYCATESGIFRMEKYDNSIDRLSKISGLSDVDVSTLRYNFFDRTLLIAYKNANIDLIKDNIIYNISDIKRTVITAKKTIHNIHFKNQLAYLACGFGIVILDLEKREIQNTCYIGKNGRFINVRDIASDSSYLYAATDSGVYRASLNANNLADYNAWQRLSGLPAGIYNAIASLNGKIYTNFSGNLMTGAFNKDTIFSFNGTSWSKPIPDSIYNHTPLRSMEVYNDELIVSFAYNVDLFDRDGIWTGKRIGGFSTGFGIEPRQAIVDFTSPKVIWIADYTNGITKNYDIWGGSNYYLPNGPNTSEVYSMSMVDEDLWVARGDRNEIWNNIYNPAEVYKFSNESWSSFTSSTISALDSMRDIVSVTIDPKDKKHVFLGSLGVGLIELYDGVLKSIWNETNSSLRPVISGTYRWLGIFGSAFDNKGNLWVSNSNVSNPLSVYKADGTWQSFNFSTIAKDPTAGQIIVNKNNQKWMVLPRGNGILVFDNNNTWSLGDDQQKVLKTGAGNGNLPSTEIECIAEDKNGEIWVGTDKGIAVFYCPDQLFSSAGCEAQQILIEQDGHTQILLETEIITSIAIDGANRKWIGTFNSGAYLMSADGTNQIQHFSVENSPLLSNEIRSIAINPKTGEVYFGTAKGIVSYRNDATEGLEDYTGVYTFPNPVQPGYDGPIAITGLIENANVKITDIDGGLVYQTKALGGQAIWYGKNFKNERAQSGVYLVYCTNSDGSKTFITKVLLIN